MIGPVELYDELLKVFRSDDILLVVEKVIGILLDVEDVKVVLPDVEDVIDVPELDDVLELLKPRVELKLDDAVGDDISAYCRRTLESLRSRSDARMR